MLPVRKQNKYLIIHRTSLLNGSAEIAVATCSVALWINCAVLLQLPQPSPGSYQESPVLLANETKQICGFDSFSIYCEINGAINKPANACFAFQ